MEVLYLGFVNSIMGKIIKMTLKPKNHCEICKKTFFGLKAHLNKKHPELTACEYKKMFGIEIETIDILMDKLKCSNEAQLAEILGTTRTGGIHSLKKNTVNPHVNRLYKILVILLERITDQKELNRTIRQIRFQIDMEG